MRVLSIVVGVLFVAFGGSNAQTGFVYVANTGDGSAVTVIDGGTNTVATTIPTSFDPWGITVSPANGRVYVAGDSSAVLTVIDAATNTVETTVPLGDRAHHVAVNPAGTRAYVTLVSNGVAVIDTATNAVLTTVPMAGCYHVAVSPDGARVYVTAGSSGVVVIDAGTNTVSTTISPGGQAVRAAVDPTGTRLYLTRGSPDGVAVIDTTTGGVLASIPFIMSGDGALALNPSGTSLYVISNNTLSVIDTASNSVVATVPAGPQSAIAVAVSQDGSRVYVTDPCADSTCANGVVTVFDTATNGVVVTLPAGLYPREIAVPSASSTTTTTSSSTTTTIPRVTECAGSCDFELQTLGGQSNVEKYLRALFADLKRCAAKAACPCPTPHTVRYIGSLEPGCTALLSCRTNKLFAQLLTPDWDSTAGCYVGTGITRCRKKAIGLAKTIAVTEALSDPQSTPPPATDHCFAALAHACSPISPPLHETCIAPLHFAIANTGGCPACTRSALNALYSANSSDALASALSDLLAYAGPGPVAYGPPNLSEALNGIAALGASDPTLVAQFVSVRQMHDLLSHIVTGLPSIADVVLALNEDIVSARTNPLADSSQLVLAMASANPDPAQPTTVTADSLLPAPALFLFPRWLFTRFGGPTGGLTAMALSLSSPNGSGLCKTETITYYETVYGNLAVLEVGSLLYDVYSAVSGMVDTVTECGAPPAGAVKKASTAIIACALDAGVTYLSPGSPDVACDASDNAILSTQAKDRAVQATTECILDVIPCVGSAAGLEATALDVFETIFGGIGHDLCIIDRHEAELATQCDQCNLGGCEVGAVSFSLGSLGGWFNPLTARPDPPRCDLSSPTPVANGSACISRQVQGTCMNGTCVVATTTSSTTTTSTSSTTATVQSSSSTTTSSTATTTSTTSTTSTTRASSTTSSSTTTSSTTSTTNAAFPGPLTLLVASACPNKVPDAGLAWSSSSGANQYQVYRDGSLLISFPSSTTSYADTVVGFGQTHTYYVAATNGTGATNSNSSTDLIECCTTVSGTGGVGMNIRSCAGLSCSIIGGAAEGDLMTITNGPVNADGYAWYYVQDSRNGVQGWGVGDYLAPNSGTGICPG